MTISTMLAEHASVISAMNHRDGYPLDAVEFVKKVNRHKLICKIAVDEGKILGYIAFKRRVSYIQVYDLFVDKEYRRQGVASRLMRHIMTTKPVGVRVLETNLAAQLFFRSVGLRGKQEGTNIVFTNKVGINV